MALTITIGQYVDWPGESGRKYAYEFLVNPRNAMTIGSVPGNYAFVRRLPNGNFLPVYFGQTDNLRDRLPSHEIWDAALRIGGTLVMAHSMQGGAAVRLAEERDLIRRWNPPLNTQHRTVSLG